MIRRMCMEARTHAWRRMGAAALAALGALASGCGSAQEKQDVRQVDLAAFATPPTGPMPEVVEIPLPDIEPPSTTEVTETTDLPGGTKRTERMERLTAVDPATQKRTTEVEDQGSGVSLRVGQRWPVESLIGQINGRPIFANQFLDDLQANILVQLAQMNDKNQQQVRLVVERLIRDRFMQQVNNELVLAEAESRLSPEMKMGLLAFLRNVQEETIAARGGSRSSAEESLREQEGMSVDQWLELRKNQALAADLLRRKVEGRVIVSWREVERLYEVNRAQFSPDPIYHLGRIVLPKADAARIADVKAMFAQKKSFSEVATSIGAANGGKWNSVRVRDGAMQVDDFAPEVQERLRSLLPGMVSEPLELRTTVTWYAIIGTEVPESVSIFDPKLQLTLRRQLEVQRSEIERFSYLMSLRKRWLSASIAKMEQRLQKIARERYIDPAVAALGANR